MPTENVYGMRSLSPVPDRSARKMCPLLASDKQQIKTENIPDNLSRLKYR